MTIKKILTDKKNENLLVFTAEFSIAFANAWRRAMIAEVPVMAVDEVNIIKNSSAMFDETLANRIGLLPLATDLKSYELPERCSCKGEGCAKCQVKLYLKETKEGLVYANSITSKDPKIVPIYGKTPILYLGPQHDVELELTAKLGKGKQHAKHNAGLIYFKQFVEIKIVKVKDVDAVIAACPYGIFEKSGNSLKLNDDKLIDCDLCKSCVEIDPAIKVEEVSDKYIFFIESFGQLKPSEIAIAALEELEYKTKEFEGLVKDLGKEK